jgi:hypothetical protein
VENCAGQVAARDVEEDEKFQVVEVGQRHLLGAAEIKVSQVEVAERVDHGGTPESQPFTHALFVLWTQEVSTINGAVTQRAVRTHDNCRAVHLIVVERAVVDAVTQQVTVDTHASPVTPVVARTGKVLHRNALIFSLRTVAYPVVQQGCRNTQTIRTYKESFGTRVVVVAVVSRVCGCGIHAR